MNSLIKVEKNNNFNKKKNFFKKFFYKKKDIKEFQNNEQEVSKKIFMKRLEIKKNEKEERILDLQQKLEKNIINFDQITDDDFDALIELYDEQIKSLKENTKMLNISTENYKNKIIEMRRM